MPLFAFTKDLIEYYKLDEILCWDAFTYAVHMDSKDLHSLVDECSDMGTKAIDANQLNNILLEYKRDYECYGE